MPHGQRCVYGWSDPLKPTTPINGNLILAISVDAESEESEDESTKAEVIDFPGANTTTEVRAAA